MSTALLSLALLFFLGHALRWFFTKTKIPDLLILTAIGYAAGPLFGFVSANDLGQVGTVLSTVALVVILYEGGLEIHAKDLLHSSLPAMALALVSFFLTVAVSTGAAILFAIQDWETGLLFGLAMGCVSAAVVMPMVRSLAISEKLKTVLSLEAAFTDVMTIIVFLVILDSFKTGHFDLSTLLFGIGPKTLTSIGYGVISGVLWAWLKRSFPQLVSMAFAGEAWALLTYGLIELPHYNGVIGVFALGLTLANLDLLPEWTKKVVSLKPVSRHELKLLSELTLLLRNFFFIYLGILANFGNWKTVLFATVVVLLIPVTRYFMARLILKPKHFNKKDGLITVAMGPRGLATAVLATLPLQAGIAGGEWIQEALFAVIPISIVATAVGVFLAENKATQKKLAPLFSSLPETVEEPSNLPEKV